MSKSTIVLVHGALTDASVWNRVASQLQADGRQVLAPAMPLRGLASDAAYLSSFLDTVEGPVVLVGHSYGGSVISHSELKANRVVAFVFVSAFAPAAGESAGELNGRWPGSKLVEENLTIRAYPGGSELYLRTDRFAEVYAHDLPRQMVDVMAASQRPLDIRALAETFGGVPAWTGRPCFAIVSTDDLSLPRDAQRFMADRMSAQTVEVAGSHASPLSQYQAVVELIIRATSETQI